MTMTSMPRSRAAATSATLVEPVSTVMISAMPPSAAAVDRRERQAVALLEPATGRTAIASIPRRRSASTSCARPVSPSASKSPNTITRSPRARAADPLDQRSASGSSRGSCSPAIAGPRNALQCRAVGHAAASQHRRRERRRGHAARRPPGARSQPHRLREDPAVTGVGHGRGACHAPLTRDFAGWGWAARADGSRGDERRAGRSGAC